MTMVRGHDMIYIYKPSPYEKDGNTGGEDDNGEEYIIYHIYDDAMINVPSANEEDGERS